MSDTEAGLWLLAILCATPLIGLWIERYLKRRPWPREQHHTYFSTCKRVSEE
jgi:hypothetical protein